MSSLYSNGLHSHQICCVHQPTRWSTLPSHVTTRPPPPPLESEASEVASRHSNPGLAQPDSRRAVTSCAPRRMETPSPDGPADLARFWTRTGRPVRVPRDVALPVVLLPDRRNTRHGRTGTQLATGPSQICISPSEPSRTDSVQGQRGRGAGPARGTILAYQDLVPRADAPRDSPSLADSSEEGSTDSETGHLMAPASRPLETSCLVPRRDAEVLGDLPQEVVDTITSARAPSTRHAYALKLAQLGTLHFQHNHRLDCTDIINWTKLDNAITKFNNEMHSADNWVLNPVILHYWHILPILILCSALLQFVLLKALYK